MDIKVRERGEGGNESGKRILEHISVKKPIKE